MSIQKQIEGIQNFLRSKDSVFKYSHLQYPNDKQQKLINAYFFVKKIFMNEIDPDKAFQQLILKNIYNLRIIIMGLFYHSLLNPSKHNQYFAYIRLFRNEGMKFYADFVKDFLDEQFINLKNQSIEVFPHLYQDLFKYRLINEQFTIAMLKSIDYIDISEANLTYTNNLFEIFEEIIKQHIIVFPINPNFRLYAKYLFTKIVRFFTVIQSIEDEGITELKQRCERILIILFKSDPLQCAQGGSQVLRYFQQLLGYSLQMSELFYNYKNIYFQNAKKIEIMPKERILSVNLPTLVHQIILFCVEKNTSEIQIYYQLNWVLNKYKQNRYFQFLLIEIERYLIKCCDRESRFIILVWIIDYCTKNSIFFELAKQALFFDWFDLQNYADDKLLQITYPGLRMIEIFRVRNTLICQQFLDHILIQNKKISNFKLKETIVKIFKMAQKRSILILKNIYETNTIQSRIKFQLSNLNKIAPLVQQVYNPFRQQQNRNQQQQNQIEVNWGSEDYIDSKQTATKQVIMNELKEKEYFVTLQKQFYEENTQRLKNLLQNPSKQTYIQFIDSLIIVIRKLKLQKQQQQIQNFIKQSSKITYLSFQSHFQNFYRIDQNINILSYFIDKLFLHWKTNAIELEIHKKIIRQLQKFFQIASVALFYLYFMKIPSTKAYYKEVFNFLIQKQKMKQIIKAAKLIIQDIQKFNKLGMKTASHGYYI